MCPLGFSRPDAVCNATVPVNSFPRLSPSFVVVIVVPALIQDVIGVVPAAINIIQHPSLSPFHCRRHCSCPRLNSFPHLSPSFVVIVVVVVIVVPAHPGRYWHCACCYQCNPTSLPVPLPPLSSSQLFKVLLALCLSFSMCMAACCLPHLPPLTLPHWIGAIRLGFAVVHMPSCSVNDYSVSSVSQCP